MNKILLHPTDVLFFRDGRPMGGASAGHGAAWPLPSVINHALHAALHRAGDVFLDVHSHRRGRSGKYQETRDRRFGSVVTAGPFPVRKSEGDETWFFPRPADADDSGKAILRPHQSNAASSLATPCHYPVISTRPPSKETPKSWWSEGAWNAYQNAFSKSSSSAPSLFLNDTDFSETEHHIGIGIDPETQTQDLTNFYSAHYLRLHEDYRLGLFAQAIDKSSRDPNEKQQCDLIRTLLNGHPDKIVVGGQQRTCTAARFDVTDPLPLPKGATSGFQTTAVHGRERWLVKWVLLTPAIWPMINSNSQKRIYAHCGGWLPNWIAERDQEFEGETVPKGSVVLLDGPGKEKSRRKRLEPGRRIRANLVAAIVPKAIPVTGYALPHEAAGRPAGGAKSTHLAVPAGAVYYFEADSVDEASKLAGALNWHGADTSCTTIRNRRSTLMGEKGFGLGVCSTWSFHTANTP